MLSEERDGLFIQNTVLTAILFFALQYAQSSGSPPPPALGLSVVVHGVTMTAAPLLERARVRLRTLESLIIGEKYPKMRVRFAHKTSNPNPKNTLDQESSVITIHSWGIA